VYSDMIEIYSLDEDVEISIHQNLLRERSPYYETLISKH
jgi:hypothetical protein